MIKDTMGLIDCVSTYIRKNCRNAVVGLSGGADSTLVACLCEYALDRDNVFGVHLPYNQLDKNTFNTKSVEIATKLKINQHTIDVGSAVDALGDACGGRHIFGVINQGNMRSRMRMVALYTYSRMLSDAGREKVRVIGTGNLSEDFIGYDTKGGDALCDFFPIGSLLKSEVYQLLDYFNGQYNLGFDIESYKPSAGLWDGQTDEEELGYTYQQMEDSVIKLYNHPQYTISSDIDMFVHDRHYVNKHKHESPPVVNLREFCDR
jgi:NAD+ synthase